ncbi:MAG: sarcosine oxidase subunit delta [Gammaproteobacteria bacterium]|nr:sarcosine oxidase subunit delta [Gammaproteobacteria bacterium]MDE0368248.1 sarcosine oxidase subunit delta [Gammaproteobacteria bacterium]
MLRIPCPFCGDRDEAEFRCGGELPREIPQPGVDDDAWSDYLFNRDNPKGLVHERWCHSFGCNQWFNVVRDTVTHRIHAVYRPGEPRPALDGPCATAAKSGG